jgi:hypothetical protein
MNGVPLAETDKIKIEGGQVTRITQQSNDDASSDALARSFL